MSQEFYIITTVKGKPKLIENYADKKHADTAMEQLKKHDKRISYSVVDVKELQKMKLDPRKDSDWANLSEAAYRKPSNNDMEKIAEDAEAAFWDVVAKAGKKYGATSGDMDPGAAFKFEHECMAAVKIWFEYNLNESTIKESVDMNTSIKSFEEYLGD